MRKFNKIEKEVFEEFYRDDNRRLNFIRGIDECEEDWAAKCEASAWCCSDEIENSENWRTIEALEIKGYIYRDDDDYFRLTAKGLNAYEKMF